MPHLPCPFSYLFQPPFVNQDTFCCNCFLWLLRLLGLDPKILLNSHVIFSVKSDLTTLFNINPPLWVSLICLIFLWGTFLHPTHSVFYTCILFIVCLPHYHGRDYLVSSALCSQLLKQCLVQGRDPHIQLLPWNEEGKMSLWCIAHREFTYRALAWMKASMLKKILDSRVLRYPSAAWQLYEPKYKMGSQGTCSNGVYFSFL